MITIRIDFYDNEIAKEFIKKLDKKDVDYLTDNDGTVNVYYITNFAKLINGNNFYIEMTNKHDKTVYFDIDDKLVHKIYIS